MANKTSKNDKVTKVVNKVYWQAVSYDSDGNLIIKVYRPEVQEHLNETIEKVEYQAVKKKAEKEAIANGYLAGAERFDNLVQQLLSTEAVYVVPNKSDGKVLAIDYDKLKDEKEVKGKYVKRQSNKVDLTSLKGVF